MPGVHTVYIGAGFLRLCCKCNSYSQEAAWYCSIDAYRAYRNLKFLKVPTGIGFGAVVVDVGVTKCARCEFLLEIVLVAY